MRRFLAAASTLVVSVTLASSLPAHAVTKEYVQLNATGRAAVVTQPAEVPSWFGPVSVAQEPTANSGATEGIFRVSVCEQVAFTPPSSQASSVYEAGSKTTFSSEMFQYPSPERAQTAWTFLVGRLDRCRASGSESDATSTADYVQRVDMLPDKYGTGGFAVFTSVVGTGERESQLSYANVRLVGAAIVQTLYVRSLPRSVKTPPQRAPFRATATVRILNDRSTFRYRQLAYKAI